jgi:hypothetical protein
MLDLVVQSRNAAIAPGMHVKKNSSVHGAMKKYITFLQFLHPTLQSRIQE